MLASLISTHPYSSNSHARLSQGVSQFRGSLKNQVPCHAVIGGKGRIQSASMHGQRDIDATKTFGLKSQFQAPFTSFYL